ncbi:sugar phosphate isomerase/epimerase family protein [Aestuariimicrobium ganziense]|uniref:sugar phosphate isomerase/epimerase family protein n=1 Tax=Aestuariimicrobium ganziense TaxID=2773677 RepID=UPI001941BDAB|nr:TIM barrel protein [Aestuariimicrobium ganziense]
MAELGLVINPEQLPTDIDLDFLEPVLMGRFVGSDDEGPRVLPDPLSGLPDRPIRGGAVLFPGTMRLADPDFDLSLVEQHLTTVGQALGAYAEPGRWVVLGSGASRRIPDEVDRQAGLARLAEVVGLADRVLSEAGLEVMLEPLRAQESNVFNDLAEGARFLDDHGLDLRMVCDTFHMFSQDLTADFAVAHLDRIGHVHLSGHDRLPVSQDADAVLDVAVALAEAGYQGRWSFECRWPDAARDVADSIRVTRERLQ